MPMASGVSPEASPTWSFCQYCVHASGSKSTLISGLAFSKASMTVSQTSMSP